MKKTIKIEDHCYTNEEMMASVECNLRQLSISLANGDFHYPSEVLDEMGIGEYADDDGYFYWIFDEETNTLKIHNTFYFHDDIKSYKEKEAPEVRTEEGAILGDELVLSDGKWELPEGDC